MSNKTRDLEILDSRVSKLLIMLKRHIKEGEITEEQLLSEETERKNADLELKALIDTKPSTPDLNNKVDKAAGKGFATEIFRRIEEFSRKNGILSIKVDTNFDNAAMLRILEKLGYKYCGEVYFRGSARKAFEKVLE